VVFKSWTSELLYTTERYAFEKKKTETLRK
jgi:hypothetical protein